jgi:hypothetical protein
MRQRPVVTSWAAAEKQPQTQTVRFSPVGGRSPKTPSDIQTNSSRAIWPISGQTWSRARHRAGAHCAARDPRGTDTTLGRGCNVPQFQVRLFRSFLLPSVDRFWIASRSIDVVEQEPPLLINHTSHYLLQYAENHRPCNDLRRRVKSS